MDMAKAKAYFQKAATQTMDKEAQVITKVFLA